ncbi:hypothetical protein RB195_003075 [Necator americanus]|uniref:alkaline phosphatase n=1 Tax=Necator americanus TaxID=51031 RepID=A0ABR1DLW9_NECAM
MVVQTLLLLYLQLLRMSKPSQEDLGPEDVEFWNLIAKENIQRKLQRNPHLLTAKRPKNVILFIGDGMGISTVTLGRINKNQKAGNKYLNKPLYFETFSVSGLVKTSSFSQYVTDSAAGAMALLSGRKVESLKLGLLPTSTDICTNFEGSHITDGIAEEALNLGMEVGFVTTTRITHATPAALYAKLCSFFLSMKRTYTFTTNAY